ncbi:hypothetical protein JTE90_013235 [Oedothorax gibbosus]|uniref:Uncharacterized protein n=1 Tax=Oedothorax gibbosus TaxID=931172 RepID=A0AAV6VFS4_9ARAC|nr:hypothetical protein JTE90_013235 [Oedothorax gibbosus]
MFTNLGRGDDCVGRKHDTDQVPQINNNNNNENRDLHPEDPSSSHARGTKRHTRKQPSTVINGTLRDGGTVT